MTTHEHLLADDVARPDHDHGENTTVVLAGAWTLHDSQGVEVDLAIT